MLCAASASSLEEFAYNEGLARQAFSDNAAGIYPCFAIHPQMPLRMPPLAARDGIEVLESLAAAGRLAAVGETGFDLFDADFKATESLQDELFAAHIDAALRYGLPVIIHTRRAMHKIFAAAKSLAKCKAVVFHSWPGTASDGSALLKRGINAYFSFGTPVTLNHRKAMQCAALFPAQRLLTETDAPFQPPRNRDFSTWADLQGVIQNIAALRREAAGGDAGCGGELELEKTIEANFKAVFGDFCPA